MSGFNFLKSFSGLNVVESGDGDAKKVEVVIKKPIEKSTKFDHSCHVIFICGIYKNYIGFVREYYPSRVIVQLDNGDVVTLNKNAVMIKNKKVSIKRGLYKDMTGTLLDIEEDSLNVSLFTNGKSITNHMIYKDNVYVSKKVTPRDVFYMDLELHNGDYFQVDKIVGDKYYGKKLSMNENVYITNDEVLSENDGFKIEVIDMEIDMRSDEGGVDMICEENVEDTEMEIVDTEDDNKESNDDIDYVEGVATNEYENVEYENNEEAKETFQDVERCAFVEKIFTKDEKDYLKLIEKCLNALGYNKEMINIYELLEKVSVAVTNMKNELKKIDIFDWKSIDVKVIVSCMVVYEIKKTGMACMKSLELYVFKLYNNGFLSKNNISDTMFLRVDKYDTSISKYITMIQMTKEEKSEIKRMYKTEKYDLVLNVIVKKCDKILQEWFQKINFDEDNKIKLMPVLKRVKEVKRFITTNDIINKNYKNLDDINIILFSPEVTNLVEKYITILQAEYENEKDEKTRSIYEFVIENFKRAPIVINELNGNIDIDTIVKCKELERVFDMFIDKVKKFMYKKNIQKNNEKLELLKEVNRIAKNRNAIDNIKNFENLVL